MSNSTQTDPTSNKVLIEFWLHSLKYMVCETAEGKRELYYYFPHSKHLGWVRDVPTDEEPDLRAMLDARYSQVSDYVLISLNHVEKFTNRVWDELSEGEID